MRATKYVPAVYIELVYVALGDKDKAFQWLDRAYQERCEYLVYLPTEPLADPIRQDPRFARLIERLGLKIPANISQSVAPARGGYVGTVSRLFPE
jgi:hypothetical protein